MSKIFGEKYLDWALYVEEQAGCDIEAGIPLEDRIMQPRADLEAIAHRNDERKQIRVDATEASWIAGEFQKGLGVYGSVPERPADMKFIAFARNVNCADDVDALLWEARSPSVDIVALVPMQSNS